MCRRLRRCFGVPWLQRGTKGDVHVIEASSAVRAAKLNTVLECVFDSAGGCGTSRALLASPRAAAARTCVDGSLVRLAEQDRNLWRRDLIVEGVAALRAALARDRLGEYQAQAAIAALHADAQSADETDWVQIVEWYDELVGLTDSPVVRLNPRSP